MHRFPFSKDLEVNRTNRGIAGEPENLVTKTVTDLVPTFHNLVRLGSWETSVAVTPKSTPHQRPAAIDRTEFAWKITKSWLMFYHDLLFHH